jgi:hypothetical protein
VPCPGVTCRRSEPLYNRSSALRPERDEAVEQHVLYRQCNRSALRTIVRRDDGRTYREMLTQMAKESGIETPTADDLVRIDRARKGKKLSNEEWISKTDPEAKIAKLKDGRTHLAYKPEHAVDLDTGVISRRCCILPITATQPRSRAR